MIRRVIARYLQSKGISLQEQLQSLKEELQSLLRQEAHVPGREKILGQIRRQIKMMEDLIREADDT